MTIDEFLHKWHFQNFLDANTIVRKFFVRLDVSEAETIGSTIGGPEDNRVEFLKYQAKCEIYNEKCGIVKAFSPPREHKSVIYNQDERIYEILDFLDQELEKQLNKIKEIESEIKKLKKKLKEQEQELEHKIERPFVQLVLKTHIRRNVSI